MTTPVGLPNYQQLRRTLVGVETVRGGGATKTNKWYGRLDLQRRQPLADSEEFAGTFFGDYTPVRGAVTVDGTYYQPMSYEDPHLFRYAVDGGVVGVSDGNPTPGWEYAFRHAASRDTLDTAAAEYTDGGLIYECDGLMFPEFTISADIDDPQAVWKWNSRVIGLSKDLKAGQNDVAATGGTTSTFVKTGAGWTVNQFAGAWVHFKSGTAGNVGLFREVLSNTSDTLTFRTGQTLPSAVASGDVIDIYAQFTAGIADRTREMIKAPGTKLYLDNSGGAIGTTEITGRFISFSVTAQLNAAYKRFMDNVDTMSNKVDRGMVRVTGQVRLEMDRKREWDKYVAMAPELIRIQQTGSTIDATAGTKKTATIDLYKAIWDDPTYDVRGNNTTATWPFRAYVDTTEGVHAEWSIKNRQSALLA